MMEGTQVSDPNQSIPVPVTEDNSIELPPLPLSPPSPQFRLFSPPMGSPAALSIPPIANLAEDVTPQNCISDVDDMMEGTLMSDPSGSSLVVTMTEDNSIEVPPLPPLLSGPQFRLLTPPMCSAAAPYMPSFTSLAEADTPENCLSDVDDIMAESTLVSLPASPVVVTVTEDDSIELPSLPPSAPAPQFQLFTPPAVSSDLQFAMEECLISNNTVDSTVTITQDKSLLLPSPLSSTAPIVILASDDAALHVTTTTRINCPTLSPSSSSPPSWLCSPPVTSSENPSDVKNMVKDTDPAVPQVVKAEDDSAVPRVVKAEDDSLVLPPLIPTACSPPIHIFAHQSSPAIAFAHSNKSGDSFIGDQASLPVVIEDDPLALPPLPLTASRPPFQLFASAGLPTITSAAQSMVEDSLALDDVVLRSPPAVMTETLVPSSLPLSMSESQFQHDIGSVCPSMEASVSCDTVGACLKSGNTSPRLDSYDVRNKAQTTIAPSIADLGDVLILPVPDDKPSLDLRLAAESSGDVLMFESSSVPNKPDTFKSDYPSSLAAQNDLRILEPQLAHGVSRNSDVSIPAAVERRSFTLRNNTSSSSVRALGQVASCEVPKLVVTDDNAVVLPPLLSFKMELTQLPTGSSRFLRISSNEQIEDKPLRMDVTIDTVSPLTVEKKLLDSLPPAAPLRMEDKDWLSLSINGVTVIQDNQATVASVPNLAEDNSIVLPLLPDSTRVQGEVDKHSSIILSSGTSSVDGVNLVTDDNALVLADLNSPVVPQSRFPEGMDLQLVDNDFVHLPSCSSPSASTNYSASPHQGVKRCCDGAIILPPSSALPKTPHFQFASSVPSLTFGDPFMKTNDNVTSTKAPEVVAPLKFGNPLLAEPATRRDVATLIMALHDMKERNISEGKRRHISRDSDSADEVEVPVRTFGPKAKSTEHKVFLASIRGHVRYLMKRKKVGHRTTPDLQSAAPSKVIHYFRTKDVQSGPTRHQFILVLDRKTLSSDEYMEAAKSWNERAGHIFTKSFMRHYPQYGQDNRKRILAAFQSHVSSHLKNEFHRSIVSPRGSRTNTPSTRLLKNEQSRKAAYARRRTRKERITTVCTSLLGHPGMENVLGIVKSLPYNAFSGDESEAPGSRRLRITTIRGRRASVRTFMDRLNKLSLQWRYPSGVVPTRGNFPRPRFDPQKEGGEPVYETEEGVLPLLRNVPLNYYTPDVLSSLTKEARKSLQLTPAVDWDSVIPKAVIE
ncbi:hypothetical protein CVT26_012657 [Gymnopilus dilepis]|uniref:Uncharacterized protein n=1 Tax=Gymnopilus dilepis TaxID=231916 RepID=A0A409YPZ0_9AGAR|nr:hypothetical protein CVT26_012657 [Gymnopilus dilepis]